LNTSYLIIEAPANFNFWRTVYSHGWCALPPFSVDKDKMALNRVLCLSDSTIVNCQITSDNNSQIKIVTKSPTKLITLHRSEIKQQIASCLRLTEDFSEFYRLVQLYPKYQWIAKIKSGRMLRAPSVFEDIVKMICTTNCSWDLTEIMIGNLVGELGESIDKSVNSFPTPEAISGKTDRYMRKAIRVGYRSPFILEFADKVANRKLNVEQWRSSELHTDELFEQLRSIKGVGEYAAGNILKLLGRYDYLGLDSWVRGRYYEIYHKGRRVSDKTIANRYVQYGKWRGLFFWLEMTKHWLDHKFPF
jgi:3-methyladenine DNA glycosylase/8-oxoguanine DNA glycosylase